MQRSQSESSKILLEVTSVAGNTFTELMVDHASSPSQEISNSDASSCTENSSSPSLSVEESSSEESSSDSLDLRHNSGGAESSSEPESEALDNLNERTGFVPLSFCSCASGSQTSELKFGPVENPSCCHQKFLEQFLIFLLAFAC